MVAALKEVATRIASITFVAATGEALPWPAPEGLALKFVAHHLYDAAERARDPEQGVLQAEEAALRTRDLLRKEGSQAPATLCRRLSSGRRCTRGSSNNADWQGAYILTLDQPRIRSHLTSCEGPLVFGEECRSGALQGLV
jgi:hypothetical protein